MTPHPDDPKGTRAIRLEIALPATPEEVWRATATGPGISAWFVPSRVEEREGGRTTSSFGPGMGDVEGVVVAWEPPRRVVFGSPEGAGMTFEWRVEAAAGGTSVLRLVNGGFPADPSPEDGFDGMTEGWRGFLAVLRAYLGHFGGLPAASVQLGGLVDDPLRAWEHLLGPSGLGLGDRAATIRPGQALALAPAVGPPLAGVVEHWSAGADRPGILVLRLDGAAGPGRALGGRGGALVQRLALALRRLPRRSRCLTRGLGRLDDGRVPAARRRRAVAPAMPRLRTGGRATVAW